MDAPEAVAQLREFALGMQSNGVSPKNATVTLDERLDGEPITRVVLLLPDPPADTWPLETTQALRAALNRRAAELGLPRTTTTLVAVSEPEAADLFVNV